jgi:hypothetical protein
MKEALIGIEDQKRARDCGPTARPKQASRARQMRVMVFADQLRISFELARNAECGLMIRENDAARRRG